jgi:hypothetical protein
MAAFGKQMVRWTLIAATVIVVGASGIARASAPPFPQAPAAFTQLAAGYVSAGFHPRHDGNRVFYAGSLAQAEPWLRFTGQASQRFDFNRYGLLGIFFRTVPRWMPVVDAVRSDLRGNLFAQIEIAPPPPCPETPIPCTTTFWPPSTAVSCLRSTRCPPRQPWGAFVLALVDKTTLLSSPARLFVT